MEEQKARQRKNNRMVIYILLIIGILIFNFPIIWVIMTAFKPDVAIGNNVPVWRYTPTLEHFQVLLGGKSIGLQEFGSEFEFWKYFRNSMLISIATTVLSIIISFPAAYSIARFKTGGGNFSFFILAQRMLPPLIFLVPISILFNIYHLTDTQIGIILVHLTFNIPFATWIIKSFIEDIPIEFEQSAYLDRYSRFDVMMRIVFPLVRSGIVAVAVICFIFSWNEFIFTLIISFIKATTLTVGAARFVTGYGIEWGKIAAASVVSMIPTISVGILGQRYLVRGLTMGAVK